MPAMTSAEPKFTRADCLRQPEGFRAELIEGSLVKEPPPSGWHQCLVARIHRRLAELVGLRRCVFAPVGVFVDEHNVLAPDILVLPASSPVRPGDDRVAIPLLVVEVLSPSTARRDREVKAGIYLRAGVEEVWIVDPGTETVEVRSAGGIARHAGPDTACSRVFPEFALDLPPLFAE